MLEEIVLQTATNAFGLNLSLLTHVGGMFNEYINTQHKMGILHGYYV
ncbi:hypothetical protein [Fictibacillus sp. KU28468]|nr:hypothetical protein [Fictibacillus sp. KU28468]UZJ80512.1 hypothetical protein OKX00_08685 [Fictibacillus sp. KU28468]